MSDIYVYKIRDEITPVNEAMMQRVVDNTVALIILAASIGEIQMNIEYGGRPESFDLLKEPRRVKKGSSEDLGRTGKGRGPVGILYWHGDLFRSIGNAQFKSLNGDVLELTLGSGAGIPYFGYQNRLRPFHYVPQPERQEILDDACKYAIEAQRL